MQNENIIYDEAEIKIEKSDNSDYFCLIENKTAETIYIVFQGDYSYLKPIKIYPNDLCGLSSKESENSEYFSALENFEFLTMYENTFEEEYEGNSDE